MDMLTSPRTRSKRRRKLRCRATPTAPCSPVRNHSATSPVMSKDRQATSGPGIWCSHCSTVSEPSKAMEANRIPAITSRSSGARWFAAGSFFHAGSFEILGAGMFWIFLWLPETGNPNFPFFLLLITTAVLVVLSIALLRKREVFPLTTQPGTNTCLPAQRTHPARRFPDHFLVDANPAAGLKCLLRPAPLRNGCV